jgi:hypothetical protein
VKFLSILRKKKKENEIDCNGGLLPQITFQQRFVRRDGNMINGPCCVMEAESVVTMERVLSAISLTCKEGAKLSEQGRIAWKKTFQLQGGPPVVFVECADQNPSFSRAQKVLTRLLAPDRVRFAALGKGLKDYPTSQA